MVAVSVLYWRIGQKLNMVDISHNLSIQVMHSLLLPPELGLLTGSFWGKKIKSVMGYMTCCDLRGHGYRLSSCVPGAFCSESQEARRSAQHYSRLHLTPPLRGGEGGRSQFICRKNPFQQCAQEWSKAFPHLKVNHVIK